MRKILLSLMALVLVIGLIGTSLVADFWDIEVSEDNDFGAGTLDLLVDGVEEANVFHFTADQLEPCDEGQHTFDLTNIGNLPGLLTITVGSYDEGGGPWTEPERTLGGDTSNDANLDEQLHIKLWQDDDNNGLIGEGEEILLNGTVIQVLSNITATVVLSGHELSPAQDGNNTKFLGFWWHVIEEDPDEDTGADNDIQGDWLSFDIEFFLRKAKGIGGPWLLDNKVHPDSGYTYAPVSICVDATNNGTREDSNIVMLDISGGGGSYHDEKLASADAGETTTVCFSWTPMVDDTYNITLSSSDSDGGPGMTIGPQTYVSEPAPRHLLPSSQWEYEVSFWENGHPEGSYSDVSDWTYHLSALNVMPGDHSPCELVPSSTLSNKIDIDHGNLGLGSGFPPTRKATTLPGTGFTYKNSTAYGAAVPPEIGQLQSRYLWGWVFGAPLLQEWVYGNYTLVSGSNIGIPYIPGNSWTFTIDSIANVGGSCLTVYSWDHLAIVRPGTHTVTVPAGTFTDCIQIDWYCDWNKDGVFDQTGNPNTDELTNRYYWSPTVMGNVQWWDYLTFDGPKTGWTGVTQIGPPGEFTEAGNLTAYSLNWSS